MKISLDWTEKVQRTADIEVDDADVIEWLRADDFNVVADAWPQMDERKRAGWVKGYLTETLGGHDTWFDQVDADSEIIDREQPVVGEVTVWGDA